MLHCIGVDRLAYLLRARREHRAVGLMEAQTRLFERQSEIVQHAPNLRFRIGDQFFIEDTMDTARQHGVEVRHELDIVPIVTADFGKIETEAVAVREILLEDGKAAAKRMAPRIDDLRVRKNKMEKPEMMKIAWRFVNEEWAPTLAMNARRAKEFA